MGHVRRYRSVIIVQPTRYFVVDTETRKIFEDFFSRGGKDALGDCNVRVNLECRVDSFVIMYN